MRQDEATFVTSEAAWTTHRRMCAKCETCTRAHPMCTEGLLLYRAMSGEDAHTTFEPPSIAGLDPLPDPQADLEMQIAAEVKSSTKRVLELTVGGFDRAPARTLRLLEQYAKNQRETLASLAIDDEPDTARPFADGAGGMMGMFREIIEVYRDSVADIGKRPTLVAQARRGLKRALTVVRPTAMDGRGGEHPICAWDAGVPAEEQALALKLAVEHREAWLLDLATAAHAGGSDAIGVGDGVNMVPARQRYS